MEANGVSANSNVAKPAAGARKSSGLEKMRQDGRLVFDQKAVGALVYHRLRTRAVAEEKDVVPRISKSNLAALAKLVECFAEDLGKQLCREAELGAVGARTPGSAGSSLQGVIIEDEDLESAMGQMLAEYMC